MSFRGRKNVYVCRGDSHHATVTVDRDEGVTPFLIECPTCGVRAQSSMYAEQLQSLVPTHEWYRSSKEETLGKSAGVQQHVKAGGLLMRRVE